MTASLVTILMPAYNGERHLAQAVQSVLAQTYPHWELVIVDDGSTDATAQIAHSFADERIQYHFQQNRGQAAALNTGLDHSRGDYITTLDVDDWYPPDSLEARVSYLDSHPGDGVVYGDGYYCDAGLNQILRFSEHMPNGVHGEVYDQLIVSPFYGTGAAVMARRQTIQEHHLRYDESIVWCQDWDFYIRLAEYSTYGYTGSITIHYRLHEGGMTLAMPESRRLDSLIRTRWKVLGSQRFSKASAAQRSAFFYDFLVRDLAGMHSQQESVMQSQAFQSLPADSRINLIRYAAIESILRGDDPATARSWLMDAWKSSPMSIKTGAVALLVWFNPKFAGRLAQSWQQRRHSPSAQSPFSLVTKANKPVT